MENADYLDFDDAVLFLKTTPSTLYKWLQAGKIPGHKLGRQWRFLRDELELHVSGKAPKIQFQKEALQFAELLHRRAKKNHKENSVETSLEALSEKMIWDAFDHGSRLIHIYPSQGKYEISYRTADGMQKLTDLQEEMFHQLDRAFQTSSNEVRGEESRRLYLQRSDEDAIQVRYQKLETVTGPRVTLRLWQPSKDVLPLERSLPDPKIRKTIQKWLSASHGIIVVTGATGSGKTTKMYSLLGEMKKSQRLMFTIEDSVEMVVEGVSQVELKSRKPEDFERALNEIHASDPDVLCLGLSIPMGLEEAIYSAVYRSASTGHLVLLQMDAATPQAALERLRKFIPYQFEHLVVGISAQKLIHDESTGKARISCELLEV